MKKLVQRANSKGLNQFKAAAFLSWYSDLLESGTAVWTNTDRYINRHRPNQPHRKEGYSRASLEKFIESSSGRFIWISEYKVPMPTDRFAVLTLNHGDPTKSINIVAKSKNNEFIGQFPGPTFNPQARRKNSAVGYTPIRKPSLHLARHLMTLKCDELAATLRLNAIYEGVTLRKTVAGVYASYAATFSKAFYPAESALWWFHEDT